MKAKPESPKYRNLYEFRDSIWFDRVAGGKRHRYDLDTTSWENAAYRRDALEKRLGLKRKRTRETRRMPTLAEFAKRYLKEDTGHLSATTKKSRESHLSDGKKSDRKKKSNGKENPGPIIPRLGELHLDEITAPKLRAWYAEAVEAKGKARSTGRNWINTLAAVYAYARDLELVDETTDPTLALRRMLSRKARSKRGRSEGQSHIRPIEDPEALDKIILQAFAEGKKTRRKKRDPSSIWVPPAAVLLLLDTGMRLGEARALTWGQIAWGRDESDPSRHVWIDRSAPSHGDGVEPTKSGRARQVRLSRRLRRVLWSLHEARFRPSPDALVLGKRFDPDNFREREWRHICTNAKVGKRALKDLRDTFASQLLTAGVGLERISRMLGHSTVALTERHYARWIDEDEDREPFRLAHGEVIPDLLARLPKGVSPHVSPHKGRPALRLLN